MGRWLLLVLLLVRCAWADPLAEARHCLDDYRCLDGLAVLRQSKVQGMARDLLEIELLHGAERVGEAWARMRALEAPGDLSGYPLEFFLLRGRMLLWAGDRELARKNFELVLERNPSGDALVEARCGLCRSTVGDEESAGWLREAIADASQRPVRSSVMLMLLRTLAEVSASRGAPEAAVLNELAMVQLQEKAGLLAAASASLVRVSEWQSQLGNWRGARHSLRRAFRLARKAGNGERLAFAARRWCRMVVFRQPSLEGQEELKKELLRQAGRKEKLRPDAQAVLDAQMGRLVRQPVWFQKALGEVHSLPARMEILGEWLQTLPNASPDRAPRIEEMLTVLPQLAPEEPIRKEFSASRLWAQLAAVYVESDPARAREDYARAEAAAPDPASRVQVLEAYLYFTLQSSQLSLSRQILLRLLEASRALTNIDELARVADGVLMLQLNYKALWKRALLVGNALPLAESPGGILLHDLLQDRRLVQPLDLYYRARIDERLARKDWREVSSAYLSQAYLYLGQNRMTEADLLLRHAWEYADKAGWAPRKANLALIRAVVMLQTGQLAEARSVVEEASHLPLSARDEELRNWLTVARAHVLVLSGQPEQALLETGPQPWQWFAFVKARALARQGHEEQAAQAYQAAQALFTDPLSREACMLERARLFARLQRLEEAALLYRQALQMAESLHSLTVRDVAGEMAALGPGYAPRELMEEAARSLDQTVLECPPELRSRVLDYPSSQTLLRLAGRTPAALPSQESARTLSRQKFLAEMNDVRARMPQLESVLGVGISDLLSAQERLPAGRVLVQFFCEPARVHILVASRDGFSTREVSVEQAQLEGWIGQMAARLERGSQDSEAELLYRLLIEPIESELDGKAVQVVPSGMFWYLPWDCLKDGRGRYLVERFNLTLLPPAQMLQGALPTPSTPRVVALGGAMDSGLPASEQEARQVAGMFAQGRALVGADANLEELRKAAPVADILHIAAHSVVGRDLNHSYIQLSQDDLPLEKIYGLTLRTGSLVVLSSCRSGLGESKPGREATSLASAFLTVGASTVLATLWRVEDASSLEFFRRYYRHLLAGQSRSEALRATRLECLQVPALASPSVWAAYTLQGEP